MGLSLRNGDYVPDGTGGLRRTEGREALLEQVLLPPDSAAGDLPIPAGAGEPGCGSWDSCPPPDGRARRNNMWRRPWAAEPGLTVEQVILTESGGGPGTGDGRPHLAGRGSVRHRGGIVRGAVV